MDICPPGVDTLSFLSMVAKRRDVYFFFGFVEDFRGKCRIAVENQVIFFNNLPIH